MDFDDSRQRIVGGGDLLYRENLCVEKNESAQNESP
jgi:hypothetical protein